MADSCEEQILVRSWSKQAKVFNEAQERLFQYDTHIEIWYTCETLIHFSSDKPVMFNSQAVEILLEGQGESVVQNQKSKIFDLKHKDTKFFTLLSHLQYIWLPFGFLNNYPLNFSMTGKVFIYVMTEIWSRCASDTSTVYPLILFPSISKIAALDIFLSLGLDWSSIIYRYFVLLRV